MKKHSKLWVLFHHPIGALWRCFITLLVFSIILMCLSIELMGNTANWIFLIFCIYVGLSFTQKHYNQEELYPKAKKNHTFLKFLFSSAVAANDSMNRKQKAMSDAFIDGFVGSSSAEREAEERLRQARKQADMAARARYDALDRAKKAEYDARDAALRGKDKAAYQYQNQADYWYNQSKR